MSISKQDIEKIASLARVDVKHDEIDEVASRITSILSMVDQMQAVDTEGVVPMANPLDARQRLRPDQVTETEGEANRELCQSIAPATQDGLFLVPKVID